MEGAAINADVITRRFRAEIAAFCREKGMTIFFASMAPHFSEHASQAMSRESVATLIPLEKHATLAQPLSQNALNRLGFSPALTTEADLKKRVDAQERTRKYVADLHLLTA